MTFHSETACRAVVLPMWQSCPWEGATAVSTWALKNKIHSLQEFNKVSTLEPERETPSSSIIKDSLVEVIQQNVSHMMV